KLNPDDVGAYLNQGDALRSKGDLAGASEDYGQAIRLAPDNPGGFGGRGQIRLFTHDFSGAVAAFDTAIRLHPNDVNSHIKRGAALSLLGENLRALTDFDKVIATIRWHMSSAAKSCRHSATMPARSPRSTWP